MCAKKRVVLIPRGRDPSAYYGPAEGQHLVSNIKSSCFDTVQNIFNEILSSFFQHEWRHMISGSVEDNSWKININNKRPPSENYGKSIY